MRSWVVCIFSFIFGLSVYGCCINQKPILTEWNTFSDDAYRSVVKLQTRSKEKVGFASVATGFAIDEKRIMTAGHFCVTALFGQISNDLEAIEVIQVRGNKSTVIGGIINIENIDEKKDVCILKTDWYHKIRPLEFAEEYDVKIFDRVRIIGSPLGHFPAQSEGRVIVPRTGGYDSYLNNRLKMHLPGTMGSSGSPVLDVEGKVIGVVIAKDARYDHVIFAVRLDTIREFFKEYYNAKFLSK